MDVGVSSVVSDEQRGPLSEVLYPLFGPPLRFIFAAIHGIFWLLTLGGFCGKVFDPPYWLEWLPPACRLGCLFGKLPTPPDPNKLLDRLTNF